MMQADCILWEKMKDRQGYGAIERTINGKRKHLRAHRVAYEQEYGAIPPGLIVRHSCDTPACINTAHLFVGTHQDNVNDMYRRGRARHARGEDNGAAKLTTEQVTFIRNSNKTQVALAKQFGITQSAVSRIKSRENWRHIY